LLFELLCLLLLNAQDQCQKVKNKQASPQSVDMSVEIDRAALTASLPEGETFVFPQVGEKQVTDCKLLKTCHACIAASKKRSNFLASDAGNCVWSAGVVANQYELWPDDTAEEGGDASEEASGNEGIRTPVPVTRKKPGCHLAKKHRTFHENRWIDRDHGNLCPYVKDAAVLNRGVAEAANNENDCAALDGVGWTYKPGLSNKAKDACRKCRALKNKAGERICATPGGKEVDGWVVKDSGSFRTKHLCNCQYIPLAANRDTVV